MSDSLVRKTILTLLACSLTSCFWVTTKEEGRKLRSEVQGVRDRIDKIERENEEGRHHLSEMIERARTEVDKLEETLNRATRVLARNSADFGAEMESMKNRLREVDGTLAEIRHELGQASKRMDKADRRVNEFALAAGLDLPIDEDKVPTSEKDHKRAIDRAYANGKYSETRALAKIYMERYANRAEADDVQLLIAKSYLKQKRWAKALGVLHRFSEKYPKSDLTPEVLYEMARAFFALGDCTDAGILIETVTTRHKKSPFAAQARALSKRIKKMKSRCTS